MHPSTPLPQPCLGFFSSAPRIRNKKKARGPPRSLALRHRRPDRYKYHSLASFMLAPHNPTDVSMSFDLVLFGGTGDLAWRKLMPALFQAFRHGSLPEDG